MSLLDLLVVLAFLAVILLANLAITPFTLAILVGVLALERVLKGERL